MISLPNITVSSLAIDGRHSSAADINEANSLRPFSALLPKPAMHNLHSILWPYPRFDGVVAVHAIVGGV